MFGVQSVGPSISPGPFNVTVTAGVRAVLSCETTGVPPPKVSWKRNGKPLDVSQLSGAFRYLYISEDVICSAILTYVIFPLVNALLTEIFFKAKKICLFGSGSKCANPSDYCPLGRWCFCRRTMRMKATSSALLSMMQGRSAGSLKSSYKVLA